MKTKSLLLSLLLLLAAAAASAEQPVKDTRSLYVGGTLGYGSTDWNQLTCQTCDPDDFLLASVPKSADDSGLAWGFFAGYQINPNFTMELAYTRFARTSVYFVDDNLYDLTTLNTNTSSVTLVGKVLVPIMSSGVSGFADAGIAVIHRSDVLTNVSRVEPTFGIGAMYDLSKRILGEIGFQFTPGFGRSEIDPVNDYVPFVYVLYARLAYRVTL